MLCRRGAWCYACACAAVSIVCRCDGVISHCSCFAVQCCSTRAAAQLFSLRPLIDIYFMRIVEPRTRCRGCNRRSYLPLRQSCSAQNQKTGSDISSNGSDACLGASGDVEESRRRKIGVARRLYATPSGPWLLFTPSSIKAARQSLMPIAAAQQLEGRRGGLLGFDTR